MHVTTKKAEAADAPDPQAQPKEIARRHALHAKLDAACARLEAEAAEAAEQARRRSRPSRPPGGPRRAGTDDRRSSLTRRRRRNGNLTDPDSALTRHSDHHEYRQAYNAQAVVDADGNQLVLATHVTRCPIDAPSFLALIPAMTAMTGLPRRVLANAGFASGEAVAGLQ